MRYNGRFTNRLHRALAILLILAVVGPVSSAASENYLYRPATGVRSGPALSVNVLADRHAISPDIYGMNYYGTNTAAHLALMQEIRLPVDRWGGNVTTRYNWLTNSFNSGFDYFFEGNPNTGNVPPGQPSESDEFINRDRPTNTKSIITIPTIGYVSKNHDQHLCGFSVAKYGPQKAIDTPFAPDCGNGVRLDNSLITNNDWQDTSRIATPQFMKDWIADLIAKYNTAANGGVKFYQLDNEPSDWHNTHRDVHPVPLNYDELRNYTYQYGAAIKQADPSALTLGPSNYGYGVYADSLVPGDKAAHNNIGFSEWYLQQMKLYEQQNGVRILDYFDQHYYPAQPGVTLSPAGDAATQQLRLRSTRSLWDPNYTDESWIGQSGFPPVQVIPTFRSWINANYPGTKTAITEYNFGGFESINGALTQADVLGIFGREQLDLATLWTSPFNIQLVAFAFRMYRNYDGAGSAYGNTWVQSSSADQGQLAIYGAQRTSDGALTLMIINKTSDDLTSPLALTNINPAGTAKIYRYSEANLNTILAQPNQFVTPTGFTTTYPANSMTMVVIPPVINTLTVKVGTDDGTFQTDTLSKALQDATAGTEIVFNLPDQYSNTITMQGGGKLPDVLPGVTIRATCNAGKPSITLDGTGAGDVDGLVLKGYDVVQGLKITKFKRSQVKAASTIGNQLSCLALAK